MTSHWDEFSKSLADESLPRRESLRRLGFLVAGAVLSPLGLRTASPGHKPPTSHHHPDPCKTFCHCRNKCNQYACLKECNNCNGDTQRLAGSCGSYICCGEGSTNCGSYCADLGNDWQNCGACGQHCPYPGPNEEVACINGNCEYACVVGTVRCDGICTRLEYDPRHCGACGNVCGGPDPHCNDGMCSECASGQVVCGGSCTDLNWDPNNCAECGHVCGGSTPYCTYGACAECPAGYAMCSGSCTDISFDSSNCGACGYACATDEYCSYGYCYYGGWYGGYSGYWWYW